MLSCRELTYKAEEGEAESEEKAAAATDAHSNASSGTQTATAAAGQVRHAHRALYISVGSNVGRALLGHPAVQTLACFCIQAAGQALA